MEDWISKMCENLHDKSGNKIDINILATVYISFFEIVMYLKKHTNYSGADIKAIAKYIDKLPGYDYSRSEIAYYRRKIENCDWDFSTPVKNKTVSNPAKQPVVFFPGETTVNSLKFSSVSLIAWSILCVFALIRFRTEWVLILWFFFIPILYEIFKLAMNRVILTNKRLIVRISVPKKYSADVPINKINGVSVKSSGNEYKYGTLQIDTSSDCFSFKGVKAPGYFRDSVIVSMEQNKSEAMRQQAEGIAKAMKNN